MRVLLVSNYYPPHVQGGAEICVAELAHGLRARGHEVLVLTNVPGADYNDPSVRNVDVRPNAAAQAMLLDDRPVSAAIRRIADEMNPDVVHVHNTHSSLGFGTFNATSKYPTVLTLHDYYLFCLIGVNTRDEGTSCTDRRFCNRCARRFYPGEAQRLEIGPDPRLVESAFAAPLVARAVAGFRNAGRLARLQKMVDRFVCVSEAVRSSFATVGVARDKLVVVPNGFETPSTVAPTRADGLLRIGFIGRLTHAKGVHVLLDAQAQLQTSGARSTVFIAGDGPAAAALQVRARELGIAESIKFLGKLDRAGVERFYGDIDVLVVPSVWPDPLPVVCCEAIGRGVPVVGSAIGGISEILAGGAGLLVPSADPQGLAATLRGLNDAELATMRRTGPLRFRATYALQPHLDKIEQIYAEAVEERRSTTT